MFGRVLNTSLLIIAFRLQYFLVGSTFIMTVTQSNWQTNERTTNYMGIINVSVLFRAYRFCINRALFFMVFLFLWISKYEIYSFKIQWKFSALRHLLQPKQSKFKAHENFPRFSIFDFVYRVKLKTWKPLKFSFFLLKHRKLRNFNPCSLMGYSCIMETNLLILPLIRKENPLKEI